MLSYLCSLCSKSWQSLHVKVSQVSQKSFSGSCLWMGQKTGLCPAVPTDSIIKKKIVGGRETYINYKNWKQITITKQKQQALKKQSLSKALVVRSWYSGYMFPKLEVPSQHPDSAILLPWQHPIIITHDWCWWLMIDADDWCYHTHCCSTKFVLLKLFNSISSNNPVVLPHGEWQHLTRGSTSIFLCVNFVVLSNFHPLVGLHTCLTKPFSTFHTKSYGTCIVFTTCAHLEKIKHK